MPRGIPNPIDVYVGARVRQRRLMLGMSQAALAKPLGITFQQIQKEENGTNRIGASRLQQIAQILGVETSFFFEGAPRTGETRPVDDPVMRMCRSPHGVALARAFNACSPRMQRALLETATAYVEAA